MTFVRHPENRPGRDPQIPSSRSNQYFSNACAQLGKIPCRRAGGNNLNGSNQRTVFRMANATAKSLNHLLLTLKPHNNKIPLTLCPFFRSKRTYRQLSPQSSVSHRHLPTAMPEA